MINEPGYVVVIPTLGRPSLQRGLDALAATVTAARYFPVQLVLADDRRDTPVPLPVRMPAPLADRALVVALEGRGPAAARNAGWRAVAAAEWVVFLDDDVVVEEDWASRLAADLGRAGPRVGGVQGAVTVPWPSGRRAAHAVTCALGASAVLFGRGWGGLAVTVPYLDGRSTTRIARAAARLPECGQHTRTT